MRLQTFLLTPALLLAAVTLVGCAGSPSSGELTFGDYSIGTLNYYARSSGDTDTALIYTNKIIEVHGPEAREMQASLSDFPLPKDVYSYSTLNGVGQALLSKADLLIEKGDTEGARAALNLLISDYGYAQYEDDMRQNWLKAAETAEQKLQGL